jgi:hypothetical protein
VHGEINRRFTRRNITRVPGHHASTSKTELPLRIPRCKVPKKTAWEKRCWPHHGFTTSPEVGPGATVGTLKTRYPRVQVPSQDRRRDMQITRPTCGQPQHEPHSPGQLRGRHMSCGLSSRCPARGSSRAAMCPAASAPAARPRAAPGLPRVLRTQLPLPGTGQLRGRHVSRGPSSRCPARGNSGAATCPTASAPAAQTGAAPGSPRVPWTPNGRCAVKVNRYPLSVAIMVTLRGVCASSEAPHDKQTKCVCKTCGQGRL